VAVIGTRLRVSALRLGFRTIFGLPRAVKRTLAGAQVRVEDQGLDLDVQLLYRLGSLLSRGEGGGAVDQATLAEQRRQADLSAHISAGPVFDEIRTRDLTVDGAAGARPARLYEPEAVGTPGPLLVFFHGGGFALGSLMTADPLCRLIAAQAQLRVLSVSYRLAPEHPYPAGLDDALAAFDWVRAHAAELGADAELVALGGDSAGGNLALVTAHERPGAAAFVMALYPVTDVARTGGSRDTFGSGFGLSADTVASLERFYLPDGVPDDDRRGAIVRADDLSAMPPVYLATAGFDPLRDEGEELAERLRRAGVPVTGRRFPGLVHGYAGLTAISATARDATLDAASALRAGLALAGRPSASSSALTPEAPSRSGSVR
jgi:acetyl esterase